MKATPVPIIVPSRYFEDEKIIPEDICYSFLPDSCNTGINYRHDLALVIKHLRSYAGAITTLNNYRSEANRLLNWTWLVKSKSLLALSRDEIIEYIDFCMYPPSSWVCETPTSSFIKINNELKPNPLWRPFSRSKKDSLARSSITTMFMRLSSLFEGLTLDDHIRVNPVQAIRQKSKFINKSTGVYIPRVITRIQIDYCISVCEEACSICSDDELLYHERNLFFFTMALLIYPRVSELVSDNRSQPTHSDFYKNNNGWWFRILGKGNIERDVAVPDELIVALFRYRDVLELPPFPTKNESTPLFANLTDGSPIRSTHTMLNLIKDIFRAARSKMVSDGLYDEAFELINASTHWLRHTGITNDLYNRPIEHVRDDAGHAVSSTTTLYLDSINKERANSKKSRNTGNR